jgi:WD40 repeat protein
MNPLIGHAGPVYSLSFSASEEYMISGSEDGTARLWSLETMSNLGVYRGHNFPVWTVDFSSTNLYFATGSYDRTARLWSCDHIYPLRIFVGHQSDVTVSDGQLMLDGQISSQFQLLIDWFIRSNSKIMGHSERKVCSSIQWSFFWTFICCHFQ